MSFRDHVALVATRTADESARELPVSRLEGVELPTVTTLAATWPAELDDDPQSGQRGLRARLARSLAERGRHVRALREALRDVCTRERRRALAPARVPGHGAHVGART